jgi:hypothetical protein
MPSVFGKKKHTPPTFCSGCGRAAVRATVLEFDSYDRATGQPVNPKMLDAVVCESVFDARRRRFIDFATNRCVAEEWGSGRPIGFSGSRANRTYQRNPSQPDPTGQWCSLSIVAA